MRVRRLVSGCCSVALLMTMSVLADRFHEQRNVTLYAAGLAVDGAGRTVELTTSDQLIDGTRALRDASAAAATQRRWLASGTVPEVPGLDRSLFRDALLDLQMLTRDHGVTVAGWSPAWRYVWPRDSALVISAYARTGHRAEAEALLDFLQDAQPPDGGFQARYRPDRPGAVPDGRGLQRDGAGWVVWALAELVDRASTEQRTAYALRYRDLLDRSTRALADGLDRESGLPRPSADYWETDDQQSTLATAAITLAGLRASARLHELLGRPAPEDLTAAADRLESTVLARFAERGFPRTASAGARSVDLGVTFLLPPLGGVTEPSVTASWARSPRFMARPAGGLAPGGSWRDDGISWTPTVASYAMAAGCADPVVARHWLGWLAGHRTAFGALPEKVLADGTPASVAPLAWTAAAVVVAGDEVERGCR
ncbi:MAG TPA: glucoamylase [Microlunatus sp.]|nr:glucoamylase [Microlunatus sp.]